MSASNVTSLHGGPVATGQPVETCVNECRRLLAMAEAGEILGISAAVNHSDGSGAYSVCGVVGGYSGLGAAQMVVAELVKINANE